MKTRNVGVTAKIWLDEHKKNVVFTFTLILVFGFYFTLSRNGSTSKSVLPTCSNGQDIKYFQNPIKIAWKAHLDECLVSCWGASFTRTDSNNLKHPRFSGYVPDNGDPIPKHFIESEKELLITGQWTDVSDDHVFLFDGRCVPTVEIEKIEYLD